jgi:hypothetical protein
MNVISTLLAALKNVREPRLFSTERGYQGQLASELDRLLDATPSGLTRPIVEQEYQKWADAHGIRLRPDIIIHIPFERGVSPTRRHDNYLVVLLKLAASQKKADEDFGKLSTICSTLEYPVGAFVNVASSDLWLPKFSKKSKGDFTLYEFAVTLHDGDVQIRQAAA